MYSAATTLFLVAETPLHAGSGGSPGAVDLPVQRERHTGYPMIQASGLKGAFRDLARDEGKLWGLTSGETIRDVERQLDALGTNGAGNEEAKKPLLSKLKPFELVFGPATDRASEHGGALAFTDARILLFPVRSLAGFFAWVTSPGALARFRRALELAEAAQGNKLELSVELNHQRVDLESLWPEGEPRQGEAWVGTPCHLRLGDQGSPGHGEIVLEELALRAGTAADSESRFVTALGGWLANQLYPPAPDGADSERPAATVGLDYWRRRLPEALAVVQDDVFRHFVTYSTELAQRIRIGETGTVEGGALWTEEYLPSDTVLYCLALATPPKEPHGSLSGAAAVLGKLKGMVGSGRWLQLGGEESIGRGIVRVQELTSGQPPAGAGANAGKQS